MASVEARISMLYSPERSLTGWFPLISTLGKPDGFWRRNLAARPRDHSLVIEQKIESLIASLSPCSSVRHPDGGEWMF